MIEAVNSVIANATVARASVVQADAARSYAANPSRIQEAAGLPSAPYLSQSIFMDVNFDQAVIRLRDSTTGEVLGQIPSEGRLEARQREQTATNIVFQTTARKVEEYTNVAQKISTPRGSSVSELDTSVPQSTSPTTSGANTVSTPSQVAQVSLSTGGTASTGVSVLA